MLESSGVCLLWFSMESGVEKGVMKRVKGEERREALVVAGPQGLALVVKGSEGSERLA